MDGPARLTSATNEKESQKPTGFWLSSLQLGNVTSARGMRSKKKVTERLNRCEPRASPQQSKSTRSPTQLRVRGAKNLRFCHTHIDVRQALRIHSQVAAISRRGDITQTSFSILFFCSISRFRPPPPCFATCRHPYDIDTNKFPLNCMCHHLSDVTTPATCSRRWNESIKLRHLVSLLAFFRHGSNLGRSGRERQGASRR